MSTYTILFDVFLSAFFLFYICTCINKLVRLLVS